MKNNKILALLFSGVLMGALDIAIIGPAFPVIKEVFHVNDRLMPWLLNIYVLFNLISTPIMGKLSDLFGRRSIYMISVAIFGFGSVFIMLSTSFNMVLVGRAVQGFGAGGIFPVASAVIGDTIPKKKQGSALGLIGAVFGLAFILGPIIGGTLLLLDWKLIFAINIPFSLIIIYYSYRVLPSKRSEEKIQIDWLGIILIICSLSAFVYSINQIDTGHLSESVFNFKILSLYIFSVILLPVIYYVENHAKSPIINIRLLKSRQLIVSYLIAFGAGVTQVAVIYLPSFTKKIFEVSDSNSSFMLMPLVLSLFVSAPIAGKLVDKMGSRIVLIMGIIAVIISLFMLSTISKSESFFYGTEVILGAGLAFIVGAPLRYIMNNETMENERASGQGLLTLFTSTGQLTTAALLGALIQSSGSQENSYHLSFQVLGVLAILVLFFTFGLKNKKAEQNWNVKTT